MSTPERSVRDVQDECALIAAELENLVQRLVRLRESLRLPADAMAIYEEEGVPWPLELEVEAALGSAVDEELEPAATRLRRTARLNAEMLRQRFLATRRSQPLEEEADR